jgi:hypothetical protein
MTAFTVTTNVKMSSLTPKTGLDTYSVNAGTLTIDSDSRFGPNCTATTGPMGNVTVSATLGGAFNIDASGVRLIPFGSATGFVPASGLTLTQGAATCELLCVMSDRTGGTVTAAGAAMPASGWFKVRSVVGTFAAGAFTGGVVASATGPDETGWIVVVGGQDRTFSIPRLGSMDVNGRWFNVGTTSGVRGQTIQLPHFTQDTVTAYPGVEIETAPGSGVYQWWPNAANKFVSTEVSTDSRSQFVSITDVAVVTIGMGRNSVAAGDLPVAGCNVRIPNIILQNCALTNTNLSVQPWGTMGTRYEAGFSNAGRLTHSLSTGAWYWNLVQPYSLYIRDMHSCDQVVIQEVATRINSDRLYVGMANYATTPFASNWLVMQQCYNGGDMGSISGLRAEATVTSGYALSLTNLYGGFNFTKIRTGQTGIATAVSGSVIYNTCDDIVVDEMWSFTKRQLVSACNRVKIKRTYYADSCTGTTPTTVATHAVECMSQGADVEVTDARNWPGVANCHPYNGIFFANTMKRSSLRYCGTDAAPFNGGTVNLMGYIASDGGNTEDIKIQRNWTTGLRLGTCSGTNTSLRWRAENNYMVDASKTIGPQQLNSTYRGNRNNSGSPPTSYIAVYGTCMWDSFTGDTTTRAGLAFAEKSAYYPDLYQVTGGTPVFSAQGAVVMRTLGDQIVWTWPWHILGWTGLTTMASQGTNTANHTYEYDLDKAGAGFSGTWKTLSNANLAAETGIDPVIGFIPKIRITCSVTGNTNRLDVVRFDGTTTLALQNAAMYPLDYATLNLQGVVLGSSVAVFASASPAAGAVPLATSTGTSSTFSIAYPYDPLVPTYTLRVRKAGYDPIDLQYTNSVTVTIPVAQQENKDGFGVAIYGRGSGTTNAFVTFDAPALRIDIGNIRTVAEDVYNVVSAWQATSTGMRYPEALRFDGTDLLLLGNWRFRRALAAYTNAGIDALPVIDGQPSASPDDEVNGSVDFRARSVRTYQVNAAPALTASEVADAVWAKMQSNGATAEANLLSAKQNAANAFAVSA